MITNKKRKSVDKDILQVNTLKNKRLKIRNQLIPFDVIINCIAPYLNVKGFKILISVSKNLYHNIFKNNDIMNNLTFLVNVYYFNELGYTHVPEIYSNNVINLIFRRQFQSVDQHKIIIQFKKLKRLECEAYNLCVSKNISQQILKGLEKIVLRVTEYHADKNELFFDSENTLKIAKFNGVDMNSLNIFKSLKNVKKLVLFDCVVFIESNYLSILKNIEYLELIDCITTKYLSRVFTQTSYIDEIKHIEYVNFGYLPNGMFGGSVNVFRYGKIIKRLKTL